MNDNNAVRDRFLQAEADATEMIEALTRLRAGMEQYRSTRESLDGAVDATRTLSASIEPIAVRMQELLQALKEMGFTAFREDLSDVRDVSKNINSSMLTEVAFTAASERNREDLTQKVEALTKLVSRVGASADRSSDTISSALRRHHRLTLGMLIGLAMLIVATVMIAVG